MTNYIVKLTPQLINLSSEGGQDSSIVNGKSIQRTFNMCEVTDGINRKMISRVNDGDAFDDVTFQNSSGTGNLTRLQFDSSKIVEGIALSNNNLTASFVPNPNNGYPSAVINAVIKNGEKALFSMVIDINPVPAPNNSYNTAVGICNDNFDLNYYLGVDSDSIGYYDGGALYTNDDYYLKEELGLSSFTSGDVVTFAVDRTNNLIWVKVNDGFWNNDASQNPLTNSGGIDISFLSGDVYPTATLYTAGGIFGKTTVVPKLVYFN